ncbi:aldehyde dehydrogenase family protein [Peptoniphilus equinus]|uniref:Aldehyde dehydrogenase family protein n=1 Tax=Peptoniphilus equinus TaxID=3016343 RepID=A0ABY7QVD4_9FIRM|nr:aldehyde dehydrogenase family protein [Peptoniphilus equinus]WBW50039.1 aldehyde dehydrogenase family protein [Peptoniphilus equinus]
MAKEVTQAQLDELNELVKRARAAQKVIENYTQEEVDKLCRAIAAKLYNGKVWAELSDEAVDETGLGDKVTKRNKRNKLKLILRDCMRAKSVGAIEVDEEKGITKYGKPAGLLAILVPTTNPCLTPAGQAIYCVKARDVMICSPHPRAKNVTNKCVDLIREALEENGAPADIVQCIKNPSIALTQYLMEAADLVIATGGKAMVHSAYSSGTPAYGSGAGNATVIIDDTANTDERIKEAAMNTRISKTADFGSGCSCDGNLVIHESVYDRMVEALKAEGGYLLSDEDAEKIKGVMWDDEGHRLPQTVAISPQKLGEAANVTIPEEAKFLMVSGGGKEGIGREHFFSSEKLTTLLTLFKYEGDFSNALEMMQAIFEVGGKGHSCGLYSFDDDHINALGEAAPVSRIMIRQPNNKGNSGSPTNGMPATSSMGCGTWGGNIVSENIALKHYMNITWLARPIKEDMPSLEDLFQEFYVEGMEQE